MELPRTFPPEEPSISIESSFDYGDTTVSPSTIVTVPCNTRVLRSQKVETCGHERLFGSLFCNTHTQQQTCLKRLKDKYTSRLDTGSLDEQIYAHRAVIWYRTRLKNIFNDGDEGHKHWIQKLMKQLNELERQKQQEEEKEEPQEQEPQQKEPQQEPQEQKKQPQQKRKQKGKQKQEKKQEKQEEEKQEEELQLIQQISDEKELMIRERNQATKDGLDKMKTCLGSGEMMMTAFPVGDMWFFGFFLGREHGMFFFASSILNFDLTNPYGAWENIRTPVAHDSDHPFNGLIIDSFSDCPYIPIFPVALFSIQSVDSKTGTPLVSKELLSSSQATYKVTKTTAFMLDMPVRRWMLKLFPDIENMKWIRNYSTSKSIRHPLRKFLRETYESTPGLIFEIETAVSNVDRFVRLYFEIT